MKPFNPDDCFAKRDIITKSGLCYKFLEVFNGVLYGRVGTLPVAHDHNGVCVSHIDPKLSLYVGCAKNKKVDWMKFKKDTLFKTPDGIRHLAGPASDPNSATFFLDGSSSLTSTPRTNGVVFQKEQVILSDMNPWIAWFGGNTPIPNGVIFDLRQRDGELINDLSDPSSRKWIHVYSLDDIIAYKIVGVETGWEL